MKILILGAAGMAGHIIYNQLNAVEGIEVTGTVHQTRNGAATNLLSLDIFNEVEIQQVLDRVKPDLIVNCIGALIHQSNNNPDRAIYTNAYFPHFLKRQANDRNARLIHLSTDCVFSGSRGGYQEDDFRDANDIYGRSKALGEIIDDKNLTIRTSIIGPELKEKGEGLFHWFMSNPKGTTINGFRSNFWSGVTTLELARFIKELIADGIPYSGLIHLTNNTKISKYDLLEIMNATYQRELILSDDKDKPVDKSFVNTSGYKNDYYVPTYREMIEAQFEFMVHHNHLYHQYLNKNN